MQQHDHTGENVLHLPRRRVGTEEDVCHWLGVIDIDHFKTINDSLGHAAGDLVLQEFARRLRQAVRASDTVFRLAGDEFTIVLEGVNTSAQCAPVAAKVIELLATPFVIGGRTLPVSASVGVAWNAGAVSAHSLSEQADRALYAAKAGGRNCFRIADSGA